MAMEGGMIKRELFGVVGLVVLGLVVLVGCGERPRPEPTAVGLLPAYTRTHTVTPAVSGTVTATATRTMLPTPPPPVITDTPTPVSVEVGEGVTETPVTATPRPTGTPTGTATPTAIVVMGGPLVTGVATAEIWTGIGTPMVVPQAVISPENVGEVTLLGRWGKGRVVDAVYSPDGQQLAVATPLGVYLYEAATTTELRFIPVGEGAVVQIAASPDWQWVAIGLEGGGIRLHSLQDGFLWYEFSEDARSHSLAFTLDSQYLLSTTAVWRVSDGALVADMLTGNVRAANGETVLLFGDDVLEIHRLVIGDGQFTLIPTGITIPDNFTGELHAAFSPDGRLLALGAWDLNVQVWDVVEGVLLYTTQAQPLSVQPLAKGRLAAPAGYSGPGPYYINDITFSPDGQLMAVTTGLGDTTLWTASDGRFVRYLSRAAGQVLFSPDSSILASWQSSLTQWQVRSGAAINTLKQHMGYVNDLTFTPDGSRLIIGSDLIYFRRVSDGGLFTSFDEPAGNVALSADGQTLASSADHQVFIWNLADGSVIQENASFSMWGVSDLDISADGQRVATVSHDDAVRVWQVGDGALLEEGYSMFGERVAFSPDSQFLATQSMEDGIGLWPVPPLPAEGDSVSAYPIFIFRNPAEDEQSPRSLTFSPDGAWLVMGGYEGDIFIWDVASGRLVYQLKGHSHWVEGVAFSPDGRLLASLSFDGSLRIWRMADGALLHMIPVPPRNNGSVAFSPDGRLIAVGLWDGTVRLWGVP